MRFTTALLSLLLPAVLVTADVECDQNSGGPSDAEAESAVNAFLQRYAPDGFYRPQGAQPVPLFPMHVSLLVKILSIIHSLKSMP
jgi:hypothetical protein